MRLCAKRQMGPGFLIHDSQPARLVSRGVWSPESIDLDRSRKLRFRETARKPAPMLMPHDLTAKMTVKSDQAT